MYPDKISLFGTIATSHAQETYMNLSTLYKLPYTLFYQVTK